MARKKAASGPRRSLVLEKQTVKDPASRGKTRGGKWQVPPAPRLVNSIPTSGVNTWLGC